MKILSLFDGISCARVALERAGIPVELYSAFEIDKYAIQISKKNYPDIIHNGSVVGADFSKTETRYDLLIGGSPCQDLSIAKANRKGLSGERSGLFWEYVRIWKEVKPKYFILENVASMHKEARDEITKVMGVEPIMIDAALVSAQRRKRLFWTNIPNVMLPEDKGILLKDILDDAVTPKDKSYCIDANYHKGTSVEQYLDKGRRQLVMKEKSNTIRSGGRGSGLGDKHDWESVYQYRRTYWRETTGGKVPTLTANMGTGGHNVPFIKVKEATKRGYAIATPGMSVDFSFPNSKTRRGRVGNKAKNLMTSQNIGVNDGQGIRKLSPVECERLQGLRDGYTSAVSNTQRYKSLGNAFHVDVVAHILSFIPKTK